MNNFYVTLSSNADSQSHPENCNFKFTNSLAEQVTLEGNWECCLHEIHFSPSYTNITEGSFQIDVGKGWRNLQVDKGYYRNIKILLKRLNLIVNSPLIEFQYYSISNRVFLSINQGAKVILGSELCRVLGFSSCNLSHTVNIDETISNRLIHPSSSTTA